jgi:hypothetical protein
VSALTESERIDGIFVPVLQITLEINELCGDSSVMPELLELCDGVIMSPSVEELRTGSHEVSVVTSPLSQTFGFEKSGDVDAPVSLYRLSSAGMWFLLLMELLSQNCWNGTQSCRHQRCLLFSCHLDRCPPWIRSSFASPCGPLC